MKRSKHSLTHYKLLTMRMGTLVPVAWFEALPGDTIQASTSALIRCAPLVTPVMHPVHVRFHWFFVPNRIMWNSSVGGRSGWEDYITGGGDGLDASTPPYTTFNSSPAVSSLADYLGIPCNNITSPLNVSVLPFRAYAMIWNEFYRDQDLQTPLPVSFNDGLDSNTPRSLQNISWEKDYLTSSRPWATKGPTVTLPLGTSAPVVPSGALTVDENTANPSILTRSGSASGGQVLLSGVGSASASLFYHSGLSVNLAGASAVDVNTLRHALALQRFQEARARYGSRFTEYLSYLGIRSSDARLQRPEYLGGGRQTIQFSEVLQTTPTTAGTAGGAGGVGQFGGHGVAAMRSNRFRRFFEEHGIVMCLASIRPRSMYSFRLKRAWMRGYAFAGLFASKEDYWQRELQHIGQQGISPMEVDVSLQATGGVFGYQDRYDEYRREESSVAGLFRGVSPTLNTWHLSREFASNPALNSSFVSCVPSTRIFADTNNDNIYMMCHHSIQARRLVSKEGTSTTF